MPFSNSNQLEELRLHVLQVSQTIPSQRGVACKTNMLTCLDPVPQYPRPQAPPRPHPDFISQPRLRDKIWVGLGTRLVPQASSTALCVRNAHITLYDVTTWSWVNPSPKNDASEWRTSFQKSEYVIKFKRRRTFFFRSDRKPYEARQLRI